MPELSREQIMLRSYYHDDEALRRFHRIIKPEHFKEDGAAMLFTVLQEYRSEYTRMPSYEEAVIEVREYRGPKQAEENGALELLRLVAADHPRPDPRWLERQAIKFIDGEETTSVVLDYIEEDGKKKEDLELTSSDIFLRHATRIYDMRETLTGRPLAGLGFDNPEYIWEKIHSVQQRFPMGLPTLDELTNGGLARGQVGVVSGGSGDGKSMTLCHIAAEAARHGASVLYINCESEDYELMTRIITNLGNVSNSRYRDMALIPDMMAVHEQCQQYRVVVKDLLHSAKPADLANAVEEFRFKFGKHPDVIVVDYLNELESEKQGKNDTTYTTVASNLKALMKLAKRANAALWTAVQLNREGIKKSKSNEGKPDATNIADSISVLFKATLVFTLKLLGAREREQNVGHLELSVNKYRFNSARPEIVARIEYQHARLTELPLQEAMMKRIEAEGCGGKAGVEDDLPPSQWKLQMQAKSASNRSKYAASAKRGPGGRPKDRFAGIKV